MTIWRWLALVVLVAAAVFAWNGGVYSQSQYRKIREEERMVRTRIDSLRREVDSLRAFNDSLATRADVQERVARERLGMVRPGEMLILLVPDSAAAPRNAPREAARDSPRDSPRDAPRDAPRDSPRDAPRDSPRDAPRD